MAWSETMSVKCGQTWRFDDLTGEDWEDLFRRAYGLEAIPSNLRDSYAERVADSLRVFLTGFSRR